MTARRRTAIVLPWDIEYLGGVNEVVRNLLSEFGNSGEIEPLLIVSDWDAEWRSVEPWNDIERRKLRLRPVPALAEAPMARLRNAALYPLFLLRLALRLRSERIEVVNAQFVTTQIYAFSVLQRLGLYRGRLVLSFHGTDASNMERASKQERPIWQQMVRNADAVIACSTDLARRIRECLNDPAIEVDVIVNGVRADSGTRPDSGAPLRDRRRIVAVGKFIHLKGHDVLLEAFGRLAVEFPDARLTLIGSDGDAFESLRRQATALENGTRVEFIRDIPQAEVMRQLAKADIFASASRSEGFGIAHLEAGIASLPVVATGVGGVTDIIIPDQTGILVPPDDPLSLADALATLMRDPKLSNMLATQHAGRARSRFRWDRAAAEYIRVFTRARGGK